MTFLFVNYRCIFTFFCTLFVQNNFKNFLILIRVLVFLLQKIHEYLCILFIINASLINCFCHCLGLIVYFCSSLIVRFRFIHFSSIRVCLINCLVLSLSHFWFFRFISIRLSNERFLLFHPSFFWFLFLHNSLSFYLLPFKI